MYRNESLNSRFLCSDESMGTRLPDSETTPSQEKRSNRKVIKKYNYVPRKCIIQIARINLAHKRKILKKVDTERNTKESIKTLHFFCQKNLKLPASTSDNKVFQLK